MALIGLFIPQFPNKRKTNYSAYIQRFETNFNEIMGIMQDAISSFVHRTFDNQPVAVCTF